MQNCILVPKAIVPKEVLALIAIYGQLGQLCIDPEDDNHHAGNTVTHACSEGTPRGGTAVLQGMRVRLRNHQNIGVADPARIETRFPFHYHV
jgi:hypothetical protein